MAGFHVEGRRQNHRTSGEGVRAISRDILVGMVAGLSAVAVVSMRSEQVRVPAGLYQASIDQNRFQEMEEMLRPPANSAKTHQRLLTTIDAPDAEGAAFDQMLAYLADVSGAAIEVE